MHAHHSTIHNKRGQHFHHPSLEPMKPKWLHHAPVPDPPHAHGHIRIGGGHRQTLPQLGQLGRHVKRNLTLHPHPASLVLGVQTLGKPLHEHLRRAVLRQQRHGVLCRSRREVDHRPALALDHPVDDHLGHPNGGINVHLDHGSDLLVAQLVEEAGIAVALPDVVDEDAHVLPLEFLGYAGARGFVEVGIVADDVPGLFDVGVVFGIYFFGDRGEFGFGAGDEDEGHALFGEG
mmetsp:Transcript_3405/g.6552  ORF Transcript_3405/g.6552 Transcript_3405/m.6552 type:complete len:233 (+) Transcript_3405:625-1323(+)